MRHGFVRLDPDKCVPLPKFMSSEFFTIAYRARRLLANRSRDAIEAFAKMLIQMHRAPGFEDPIYSILENWDPMDFDA